MKFLNGSRRCRLFELIASNTWQHMIRNHQTGIQLIETGRTNDIIAEIRDTYLSSGNVGVWANPGHREIDHGSDMDIFVETNPGRFVWWALQAKVLSADGTYKGLKKLHNGEYQWDKLERLQGSAGCFIRYLLYNGVANYEHDSLVDSCNLPFPPHQYGCSLVEIPTFKSIALARVPRFRDFHPDHAEPWRIIPCCLVSSLRDDPTYYNIDQVRNGVSYYEPADGNPPIFSEGEKALELNNLPVNAIRTFTTEAQREPQFSMVLRTTASL
ncbi:MAG: hypothetical protein U0176_17760 [Bacteroidia bacterium]